MVILALRVPSNSVSLLHGFAPYLHTSFPICLLKSSCNSYPTSTCLMTNTLRVLESRVFLHYLIKNDKNEPKNVLKVLKILTIQSGINCPINIPTIMAIINLGTKPNFLLLITFPPTNLKYFIFI